MTKGKHAAAWAKAQDGTPYSQMDCIRLVVNAIRKGEGATGESLTYQCGGTNELWRSLNKSGKYRYVTRRLELETAQSLGLIVPGALLVIWEPGYNEKYNDFEGNCSHIGMYVGDGDCEVIHSSATKERVAPSTLKNGWTHVLIHRLIDLEIGEEDAQEDTHTAIDPYEVIVTTSKDPLTVRSKPSTSSNALGKVKKGGRMTVVGLVEVDRDGRAWMPVEAKCDNRRSIVRGYAAAEYLTLIEDAPVADSLASEANRAAESEYVSIPRDTLLELADKLNAMDETANSDAAAYLSAVNTLITCARSMTQYLKGDD